MLTLVMLLALLGGVVHTAQHDIEAERLSHVAHVAHFVADDAAHDDAADTTFDATHSDSDCLLGDLAATPSIAATPVITFVVLPRPDHPIIAARSHAPVGLQQARAPPISL